MSVLKSEALIHLLFLLLGVLSLALAARVAVQWLITTRA